MVQVIWSRRALADLAAIESHIHQFRPLAAQRMALRLVSAAMALETNPNRGRIVGRFHELATVPPYIIRYRVTNERVQIIRIKHGAQRPD